jgi:hypothetical protein
MVYVFGDFHGKDDVIGNRLWWSYNCHTLKAFFQNIPFTKNDTVIQVGDLGDKTSHRGITNKLLGIAIKYLCEVCGEVILLQGNHDTSLYAGSYLRTFDLDYPNLKIIEDIEIYKGMLFLPYIEGLRVNGKYEERVLSLIQETSAVPPLIFGHHFFEKNAIHDNPYIHEELLGVKNDYIFVQGHDHKFQEIDETHICIGSMCPEDKSQAEYDFQYMTIADGYDINFIKIDPKWFIQFKKVNLENLPTTKSKDFYIVEVSCKESEQFMIEKTIRSKIKDNLYEIVWNYTDVEGSTERTTQVSDEDLVKEYMVESKVPAEVESECYHYIQGV